jgi:hypothetical protein
MNIVSKSLPVKALSVAGPFPWRIAQGHKQIELRSWATAHQGVILLHASSGAGYEHLFEHFGLSRKDCPKFSIVGAARLKTCIQYNSEKLWEAHRDHHCWVGNDTYLYQFH